LASLLAAAAMALMLPSAAGAIAHDGLLGDDTIHTGPDFNGGQPLPIAGRTLPVETFSSRNEVGDRKYWFALDDARGEIYLKRFTLRGKGDHVEVWVTPDLSFPAGDCRNDDRVKVTDAQVRYLINQFDNNIYPKESRAFSRPPDRDGRKAQASNYIDVGPRYYRGPGDKIVVLVDNVRDDNYYDTNNSGNRPYIIGFFYSEFNELTDRNVMTIDGYDWIHRTRENPPHEPDPGDLCRSMPARPHLIEQTFAHEYQHLLEYYEDPTEKIWINEGLSDWAQTLTGYADPRRTVVERGFDRHIECFLGWCNQMTDYNPNPTDMGPENSLTVWEDQGSGEILADYGAAYTFMEMLSRRYGRRFMKSLHRNNYDGFRSVRRILRRKAIPTTPNLLVADWAAALALDAQLDRGAALSGGNAAELRVRTLTGRINWDTAHSYSSPGAPPNGSDYVRLRDANGAYLSAANIETISFAPAGLPPKTRFTVQLVAYDDADTAAWIGPMPADGTLSGVELDAVIGTSAETVAAIVTFHDPTESQTAYARYTLEVNGVLQPGG
jgi:hypothetical protein